MIATMQQLTLEYCTTLPQVFISHMRQFVLDHQNTPPGCHISLEWKETQETNGAREESRVPRPVEQGNRVCSMIMKK